MSNESEDFRPNSINATLGTILERLRAQDRAADEYRNDVKNTLQEICVQVTKTNGRVTSLERWRTASKAKIAALIGFSSGVATLAGWLIEHFLLRK